MKIEDIKPGDVLVRTVDGVVNKVAKVTPDGRILRSAYTDMENKFCICLKPNYSPYSVEYFEPATKEQSRYINSKLFAFFDNPHAEENERLSILASLMSDLKKEKDELAERVKQLMDDYNRVVKRIKSSRTPSDIAEALDKLEELERDRDFFKKEYNHGQRLYESLFNQHDIQSKELEVVREERNAAKSQYNDLQQKYEELRQQYDAAKAKLQKPSDELKKAYDNYRALREDYDIANSCLARFENAEIEHANCSTMLFNCPHGVEAKVCSAECLGCEHCLTHGGTGTESILCAYNYDKEKERQQHEDNFYRKMNQSLNS